MSPYFALSHICKCGHGRSWHNKGSGECYHKAKKDVQPEMKFDFSKQELKGFCPCSKFEEKVKP